MICLLADYFRKNESEVFDMEDADVCDSLRLLVSCERKD